ncbi:hypothetical protein B0H12DRAFT_378731 [Mycena haematopus]|nr:hypothetical protein B0H12DRAFT_378731 [Mycena haematopus]
MLMAPLRKLLLPCFSCSSLERLSLPPALNFTQLPLAVRKSTSLFAAEIMNSADSQLTFYVNRESIGSGTHPDTPRPHALPNPLRALLRAHVSLLVNLRINTARLFFRC